MRAVIYARYSTDLQSVSSIEDQVRLCRERLQRDGHDLVEIYSDRAVSGATLLRSGIQLLMQDATRGAFDRVYAEALDRISRDQEDAAGFFKRMAFAEVTIVTLAEGEISELHVGLKGTMNALFLKDLAQKTRRGLQGRVLQGLSGGGVCYGYDLVAGETGSRRVNAREAKVVQAIFREFTAGLSPRAIARKLNQKGIAGPSGGPWRDTTIRGHFGRGTGILNNELYIGRLIWNRLTYLKDPKTGRRRSRHNPPEKWIVQDVPALRIVDDDLWQAVKTRQGSIRASDGVAKARATRFWERRRSRHLLSGLVRCKECGSHYAAVGRDYLACSAARGGGTCSNRQSIRRGALEALILDGLRKRLMAPDLVEEFIRAFQKEVNLQRREDDALREVQGRELANVRRKLEGLIEAIADGLRAPGLQQRLDELEARRSEIEQGLASAPTTPVRLHPNLAQVYRQKIEQLQLALDDPEIRDEAVQILRSLIEYVSIGPTENGLEIEIVGEIAKMVELGIETNPKQANLDEKSTRSVKVVAGAGFEPATFRL
ncbi:MAG: recombinase family protein [Methyloceanibacter sp.]|nr:recombinase family protein [Methyloceanibacter sp.]